MALRFESAGPEYALRNATVFSHNAAYTMFAWVYLTSDTNAYSHFLHVGDGDAYGGNTDFIGTDSDGTTIRLGCYGGSSDGATTGAAVPVGSWIWVAMVREAAGSLKFYRGTDDTDGSLLSTNVSNTAGRAAAGRIQIGSYNASGINGRIAYPKIWTRALTLANLNAEAGSAAVVDATNIWSAPPFAGADVAAALLDGSGNGRDFTTGAGTLSLEADPPLGPAIIDLAATAAAVATATADLSVSGVVHKPNSDISGTDNWQLVGGASAAAVLSDGSPLSYARLLLNGVTETPLVMDVLPTPIPAGTGIRRWHARVNNGLGEVKLTLMDSSNTPLGDSGWVAASSTMTTYSSAITISSTATRFKIEGRAGTPITGLIYPNNNVAGSNIQLEWSGANLFTYNVNTSIWEVEHTSQLGYYGLGWLVSHNDATWHGNTNNRQRGSHPWPGDGTFNAAGQGLNGSGSTGTVQFFEIANTASDFISNPSPMSQASMQMVYGTRYKQAVRSEIVTVSTSNDTLRHTFWPDLSNTAFFIQRDQLVSGLHATVTPVFYFGASKWTATGGANEEALGGMLRNLGHFDAGLSIADIVTEAYGTTNAATTAAGIASIWYMNRNPTPDDITDKQTQRTQHTPVWSTESGANRPTLYTG